MQVNQDISHISIKDAKAMMRKVITVAVVFELQTYLV
jgi:hypothetical protein